MPIYKIPAVEFIFSFSRSSGPGGQNVNKVNTKATLQWNVFANNTLPRDVYERFIAKYANRISFDGFVTIVSQKTRSQNLNATDVVEKLHEMIDSIAIPKKIRKPTKPSRSAVNKRLNEKKSHGDKKKSRQEKF
jgi:ribosome-associated protein